MDKNTEKRDATASAPTAGSIQMEKVMDEMFIFKVRDYTTHIVGRRYKGEFEWIYYVERGDGKRWEYEEYRVEWAHKLIKEND